MNIVPSVTDAEVLRTLGERIAAIRLEHNLTQAALAEQAGVSKRTVERLESGESVTKLSGFVRVCRALGLLDRFNALIPESAPSPIEQLRLRGRQRKRASGTRAAPKGKKPWSWGTNP